ncbi:hypothetical protein BGZ96_006370 [Linnemannia gamsii]|uniref:BHLH domain-containing protein n=1 Tax=Linnemannia gamsii TaxID=64522 RepID=A0ABQ7K4T1_9FUNG|nr:hypothetical protein BGZ96_006370 [Linnemannia gamsii]
MTDFRFANQDFLNMSTVTTAPPTGQPGTTAAAAAPASLPGMMMMMGNSDPSMQLFNPSEQRYFSEFLDTLVVDQDFTFDPSAIPNLPNLPLFSQDMVMPGGFNMDINTPYRMSSLPAGVLPSQQQQQQQQQAPQLSSQQPMDYDMSSPAAAASAAGHHAFNDQASAYTQHPISVPAKRSKTNKGASSSTIDSPARRGSPSSSRPSSIDAHAAVVQDPAGTRIATPIQQLSKLSLNQSAAAAAAATTSSTKAKKNKREEDDHAQPGTSNNHNNNYQRSSPTSRSQPYNSQQSTHQQRRQKDGSHDQNTSMSDEDGGGGGSDSNAPMSNPSKASTSTSASAGAGATNPKRKPYKELLTEEEKRANHIASEQKRRNTIRNGFKDMTDIIPDLKDVNSSKSTILFKAVDFIKHLERRNRLLQEKATQLESRLFLQKGGGHPQIQSQAQGQAHHQQQQQHHHQPAAQQHSSYRTSPYDHSPQQQPQHTHLQPHHQQQQQHHSHHQHQQQQQQQQQQQHHHNQQPSYHTSGLDDKRLQEIPNIYPVSMSR